MKSVLLSFLLLYSLTPAQTRPANLEIPITVYDNSGLPLNSRTLIFGVDSIGTDGLDPLLGEIELPCLDCPPTDHFNAVFELPPSYQIITWKDIRQGVLPYSGVKTHWLTYQYWLAATQVFISWNFPSGVTAYLTDLFGGVLVNHFMSGSGTFTDPILMSLHDLKLIVTYDNAVPVELTSFEGTLTGGMVMLNWSTASELNNRGFEIERTSPLPSSAGKVEAWEAIGFVEGKGTASDRQYYSFTDQDPGRSTILYRLKQIDLDGSFNYSKTINVEITGVEEFALMQNYPNPFNPATRITYSIPEYSYVTIKIFDILGNEIETLVNEEKPSGRYEVNWNAADIPSGVFFYKLTALPTGGQAGSFVEMKKMILLK